MNGEQSAEAEKPPPDVDQDSSANGEDAAMKKRKKDDLRPIITSEPVTTEEQKKKEQTGYVFTAIYIQLLRSRVRQSFGEPNACQSRQGCMQVQAHLLGEVWFDPCTLQDIYMAGQSVLEPRGKHGRRVAHWTEHRLRSTNCPTLTRCWAGHDEIQGVHRWPVPRPLQLEDRNESVE